MIDLYLLLQFLLWKAKNFKTYFECVKVVKVKLEAYLRLRNCEIKNYGHIYLSSKQKYLQFKVEVQRTNFLRIDLYLLLQFLLLIANNFKSLFFVLLLLSTVKQQTYEGTSI